MQSNFRPYNQSGGRMNNFEKIKNMTLDEMAEWIINIEPLHCRNCPANKICFGEMDCKRTIRQWLQAESEE